MTNGNRGITRAPGRTPPFILVGLLVIVAFLGYSYWSLSSRNSQLASELETVHVERKEIEQKNSESEKNLENTREELRIVQGHLDKTRKDFQDKETEYNNLKTDLTIKQTDFDKLQRLLGDCEASLSESKSATDTLKNEKAELERQLSEAKQKQSVCDLFACTNPVREILIIVAKAVGSDAVGKALYDANLDTTKLLEGINFPAPVAQQINDHQQQQQPQGKNQLPQGQDQQQQVQKQQQGVAIPNQLINESQVKVTTDVDNNNSIAEDNEHVDKDSKEGLVFQSEKDKNIAEITKYLANSESEKKNAEADGEKLKMAEIDNNRRKEAIDKEEDAKEANTNGDEDEKNVDEGGNH